MTRKIVIASGKGGVGKTTVASYVGRFLSKMGKRVLIIDADFGLNNLDMTLGAECFNGYDLYDVLEGNCRLKQALVLDRFEKDLMILSSDKITATADYSSQTVKAALMALGRLFDYILIDAPAGIDDGFLRAVELGDEAIVVTTTYPTGLRDADKVITLIESYHIDKIHLVINKARGDLMYRGKCLSVLETEELLKRRAIGVIPDDDAILIGNGDKLSRSSRAYGAFKLTAENLEKNTYKVIDPTRRYSGFFGSIKRAIKTSV